MAADERDELATHVARSAHDLHNALGAVLNYAMFLQEDLVDSHPAQEYLTHLVNAAERAVTLVDGLGARGGG